MGRTKGTKSSNALTYKDAGVNMDTFRTLSPHISFVAPLQSEKWCCTKTIKGVMSKAYKIVGYRFYTDIDISVTTFNIIDRNSACTTDPNGYEKCGTREIAKGTSFDLNLFETMVFFMRDDIFGIISGGGVEVGLLRRTTLKDYETANLKYIGSGKTMRDNGIFIDKHINGVLVPNEGFEQYSILYGRKRDENVDAYASNVMGLRFALNENIWH